MKDKTKKDLIILVTLLFVFMIATISSINIHKGFKDTNNNIFVANINYIERSVLFCNPDYPLDKFVTNEIIKKAKIIEDWKKTNDKCIINCTKTRIIALQPEGTICVEYKYGFLKSDI